MASASEEAIGSTHDSTEATSAPPNEVVALSTSNVEGADDGLVALDGDEATQLAALGAGVRDQDDLERDIGQQADQLLVGHADERDKKRLEKTQKERDRIQTAIRVLEKRLTEFGNKK